MMAARQLNQQDMSLNKALRWCGVTRKRWYHKPKVRESVADPSMMQMIQKIREERPFYGTRRIAAELSRRLDRAVNRKLVQCAYKKMGWSQSKLSTKDPKTRWKPIQATRPNQFWETDITYIWCGQVDGWCYCFNVVDIFTRKWLAYKFDTMATNNIAVESIVEAVAVAKPDCTGLTLQCDNGSQYTSKNFRKAISHLGIKMKYIWIHTPQQNGHIEPFHNTLKREYIWPHDFANYQAAEATIAEAYHDYNQNRLHSALKYVPPDEFLASWEAIPK